MHDLSYKSPEATAEGTKQVKIRKSLHKRLKEHAAQKEQILQEVIEAPLWQVVGGQPVSGEEKGK